MHVIGGRKLAGKVSRARGGLFYVVTEFEHLFYFPILPLRSYAVLGHNPDGSLYVVPIHMSFKSVLMGWFRTACVAVGIVLGLLVLIVGDPRVPKGILDYAALAGVALAPFGILVASYYVPGLRWASYRGAMRIAQQLSLSDIELLSLEIAYGRLTAEQADAELARREAHRPQSGPRPPRLGTTLRSNINVVS